MSSIKIPFKVNDDIGVAVIPDDNPELAQQWLLRLSEMQNVPEEPVSQPSQADSSVRPKLRLIHGGAVVEGHLKSSPKDIA